MSRYIYCAASMILLASCASKPDEEVQPAPVYVDPVALVPAANVIPKSALGPQQLLPKECGLFLWSQTDQTQFIYFQKAQSGTARMQISEAAVDMVQTSNRGDIFGQFLTEQGFAAPQGEQVEVVVVPGAVLEDGQRVDSGRITITTPDSWTTVIPVLGVQACQP